MAISFVCSKCHAVNQVDDDEAGHLVPCASCRTSNRVGPATRFRTTSPTPGRRKLGATLLLGLLAGFLLGIGGTIGIGRMMGASFAGSSGGGLFGDPDPIHRVVLENIKKYAPNPKSVEPIEWGKYRESLYPDGTFHGSHGIYFVYRQQGATGMETKQIVAFLKDQKVVYILSPEGNPDWFIYSAHYRRDD